MLEFRESFFCEKTKENPLLNGQTQIRYEILLYHFRETPFIAKRKSIFCFAVGNHNICECKRHRELQNMLPLRLQEEKAIFLRIFTTFYSVIICSGYCILCKKNEVISFGTSFKKPSLFSTAIILAKLIP